MKLRRTSFPTGMDIQNYELMRNEDITDTIKLTDSSGVKMKYPNYALVKKLDDIPESERKIKVVINSIEHIYDKKGVYSSKDYSTKELQDFVEGLTEAHYKKLENFIDNFPTMVVRLKADCPKCGYHHEVRYSDFLDFFY